MAGTLNILYSVLILLAAVGGMVGTMYVTRGPEGDDTRRLALTAAAVVLFVVALVVSLLLVP